MILIYVNRVTSRLEYALDFVFKTRGIAYKTTSHKGSFTKFEGTKLNYSDQEFENTACVFPASILFSDEISGFELTKAKFHNFECLSFNDQTDPFASIFYVLTRMEEYNPISKDEFGRFLGESSIQYQFGWLEQAICDRWSIDIIDFLKVTANYHLSILKEEVNILPTFDIDNAYAYKYKGLARSSISNLKDFFLGRSKRLIERQRVQAGIMKDPFDTYDKIISLKEHNIDFKMFWLLGDFAKYDRNISHRSSKHKKLIQRLSKHAEIGIHPSVKSNSYDFFLHNEIERLERILGQNVSSSRQHFLILKFPITYQTLLNQEITDDYTMGYSDLVGFRAGTARPFQWFDLIKNETTKLTIHPFVYMDITLNEHMKLSIDQAIEKITALYNEIKQFGGSFSFIWHNETIGNYDIWKGWSEVFDKSISLNLSENPL
jgi:hypothetical protein